MYAAFPRSNYYGSSALGGIHLRPSRLAQFRAGQTLRVPVFRFSTFMHLGGVLYPWRFRETSFESTSRLRTRFWRGQQRGASEPRRFRSRVPPTPSRQVEAAKYKVRGVRRTLRCLALCTVVARRADDGRHPIQFRPICSCHPTGDARSNFSASFRPMLSPDEAALQPPVKNQQALRG